MKGFEISMYVKPHQYKFTDRSEDVYNLVKKYLEIDYTLDEYLTDELSHQLCVYDNGKLVACVIFEIKGDRGYIDYCVVDYKYRNRKINRQMLKEVIQYGEENGIVLFTVNIRENNIPSIKSHESVGFKIVDNYTGEYSNGDVKLLLTYYIK